MLRSDVHDAFAGVDVILHAGDVGGDAVLDELESIAPVHAVCGNTDASDDPRLAVAFEREFGRLRIHVSHGHELGSPPTPAKLLATYTADVIVYGHTHRQQVLERDGRWVVNPGAAGPRRFNLLPSVARLEIAGHRVSVEVVELDA